jgi:uncharacterized repeat protein (TIGR03803 family)
MESRNTSSCFSLRAQLLVLTMLFLPVCWAQQSSEAVLHSFLNGNDGAYPIAPMFSDGHGNFYGTTAGGGGHGACGFYAPYCGTVFQLTWNGTGWEEAVLYAFSGGSDGALPIGQLVQDNSGNLYGVTQFGGGSGCNGGGCGTVFELSPSSGGWTESLVYSFSGGSDGSHPYAGMIFDGTGNLYGTASEGGAYGNGTVFELSPNPDGSWSQKVLYAFNSYYDGAYSTAGVVMDTSGNLYGTTFSGGDSNAGTVFRLSRDSKGNWKEIVLHSFDGKRGGANPNAGVILDKRGNLYGSTEASTPGAGIVFELVKSGSHYTPKTLYRFTGGKDGNDPFAGVMLDKSGRLYGTTIYGGAQGVGTVYELARSGKSWKETVLRSFNNRDGGNPLAGLIFDHGNLYGTASRGGSGTGCRFDGCGVLFEIKP